jgi:carboxypeptidase C (cathepsin A)
MLLNDIAILGLGTEDTKSKSNKDTYLNLVKNDTALVTKVKDFLTNLKTNKDLQHELEELKTLQYQQAHLKAQKQLTKTFITLKSINNHVKKIQPASKDDVPINAVLECVQSYEASNIN